jgi:2'-5' RNA ligase
VRLFAALDLPPAAVSALAAIPFDEDLWRRVRPETLHVTLAFLGERDDAQALAPLISAHAGEPAPRLAFVRVTALRHALAVELAQQGLAELQEQVARELGATEARAFRPHVTIARLRPRMRAPRAVSSALAPLDFHGTAVTLYRSVLHPSGARYEPLATAPLAVP